MKDKIVIITGANSGIGKAATIKFCKEGYTVVMACRNLAKSKYVQDEIIKITNNHNLDLLELDVSSFKSIRTFKNNFINKYNHLDILIHNAGHFKHGEKNYQLSADNIELTFATNTFGPFLLTNLLIDHLLKSNDARVLNACSTNVRHFFDPKREIDLDNLQGEYISKKKYNSYKMYGDSKMALLMLTFKLADHFKNESINFNAIEIPAVKISKDTIKKLKSFWRLAARVQNLFSSTPESMAETYYHICTTKSFDNISGKLINSSRKVMKPSPKSPNPFQAIKQIFDNNVYPRYANNETNIDLIWKLAKKITQS